MATEREIVGDPITPRTAPDIIVLSWFVAFGRPRIALTAVDGERDASRTARFDLATACAVRDALDATIRDAEQAEEPT